MTQEFSKVIFILLWGWRLWITAPKRHHFINVRDLLKLSCLFLCPPVLASLACTRALATVVRLFVILDMVGGILNGQINEVFWHLLDVTQRIELPAEFCRVRRVVQRGRLLSVTAGLKMLIYVVAKLV